MMLSGLPLARLVRVDRALALQGRGIEPVDADGLRPGRRDMHGQLLAERREALGIAGRVQPDQDADGAEARRERAVDVGPDHALADLDHRAPAQVDVLADHRHRLRDLVRHGAPARRHLGLHQAVAVAAA